MKKIRWSRLGLGLLLAAATVAPAGAEDSFKVVVHPSNPVMSIKRAELAAMFLRSTTRWNDGRPVQPVDQSAISATRDAFSRQVLAMTIGKVIGFWQQQAYSGRLRPPSIMASDEEVVTFVAHNASAVGYVARAVDTPNVKVLRVD